tara:strand:- start:435 stop:746 length:312 start_codon:yes stop_codon:yes gene_type:complete
MVGELAEWSIAVVLKTTERENVPGVRIPHSPQIKQINKMKHILLTTAIFGLISCSGTHSHEVKIMGTQPTDANDLPFEIDSIQNVGQLLDSLEAVVPKNENLN